MSNDFSVLPADIASKLTDADRTKLQHALADAVGVVTGQGREELARFIEKFTPAIATYGTLAAAGDKNAQQNLRHLQVQMVETASTYGVTLLQKQEQALQVALGVFSRLAAGLIVGAA
jgi:hypothetical protein